MYNKLNRYSFKQSSTNCGAYIFLFTVGVLVDVGASSNSPFFVII